MNMRKQIRIQKLQNKNHMVGKCFSVLGSNERRENPWLGAWAAEPANKEEVKQFIKEWHEETARMLKENPNLKIVS